jgi:hypothetical protein
VVRNLRGISAQYNQTRSVLLDVVLLRHWPRQATRQHDTERRVYTSKPDPFLLVPGEHHGGSSYALPFYFPNRPFDVLPAMSVGLFQYRGAAKDGGTLEYVFEAGEQNSPNP